MRQLTKEHTDYILEVLIEAEQLQRLFPDSEGSLPFVLKQINDIEMMLELKKRVQNHLTFSEIVKTNFGWVDVE